MDKKIWAIIAIIAFHLTLMWFIRGSLKPEELARASDTTYPDAAAIEPNPYMPVMPVTAEVGGGESVVVPEPAPARKFAKTAKTLQRQPHPETITARFVKPPADQNFTASTPLFKDTIIVVKQAEVRPIVLAERPVVTPKQSTLAADIAPIKKRQSFFKRAVRKPYDWIKTLISKL
jgi:hypothetical protein